MSAKLLYNLSDENPNLNKQFGCMNGIFQVFYRQHYPARRVTVAGDELKSLPSGKTSDNVGVVTNVSTDNKETEKSKKKKAAKEKQKVVSSESSSRLSFSSSPCSSSFSSADISTTTSQFEQPGLVQTSNGETQVREATNGSPRWGGLMMSSDLRELVRSSIHKETRTRDGESALSQQQPKPARANVSLLKESSPSRNSNEWSEGRRVVKLKDSPRFSYDERETRKTGAKFKETPRLSLDSRSNSFRSAKSSCSPEPQELVPGHRRTTSSVVAKLMGLDVILDEPVAVQNRENHFCDSPRPTTSRVEVDVQRSRSYDSVKKMMMPAKFPMKTAPWTQVDGAKNQVKAADAAASLTVYGEIQKRLSQLEFKKSEKDLRALQQILEAMEKTQQLMSRDDDNSSLSSASFMQPSPSPKSIRSSSIVVMKAASAPVFKETGNSSSTSSSPRSVALPNVKVSNLRQNQKVTPRKQSAMDVTPRPGFYKGQTDSPTKNSTTRSLQSKIEMAKSGKSQKPSVSPRTQPKKLGFEKQSRPTSPKPEPNKNQRKQVSKQQTESASPRRKPGMKSRGMQQQSEDRLSDESSDLRSLRSDSNLSSASNLDTEVTSRYKCDLTEQHTPKQRSPELGIRSLPKPLKITVEQPSPVSILDVAFDDDESPSPVRKISIVFKDDEHIRSEESQWVNKHTNLCRSIVWPESNTSLNQSDAELTESLMEEGAELRNGDHKYISEILSASGLLKDIDYNMLSIQLHQAHLPINPSLFFVLEQSKTGNVRHDNKHRGRGFGQQQAANLIERSRRKLVFDTVNEILARKFAAEGCTKQPYITSSISSLMTTDKSSRGKELLESLCSEIDRLQDNSNCILDEDDEDLIWEDMQSQGMNWKEMEGETPGLVLDIERLIFKDLISEVVTSEVAAFPGNKLSGQPRQLFHC